MQGRVEVTPQCLLQLLVLLMLFQDIHRLVEPIPMEHGSSRSKTCVSKFCLIKNGFWPNLPAV